MTPEKVEDAVGLAYHSLKESAPFWRNKEASGFKDAVMWQSIVVSDMLFGLPIMERGELRFVLRVQPDEESPGSYQVYDEEKGARLIDRARTGDCAAEYVLCDIAAGFLESGRGLPKGLREYIAEKLRSVGDERRKRRGRDPNANHPRNFHVAWTIRNVMMLDSGPRGTARPRRNRHALSWPKPSEG